MLGLKPSFRKSTFFNLKVPEKNPQENSEMFLQIPVHLHADV